MSPHAGTDAVTADGRDRMIVQHLTLLGLVEWPVPVRLTDADVDALCATAPQDGLVCLLGAAIELGRVEVSSTAEALAVAAWTELMARAVQLDELLLRTVAALAAAGVPSRALKGAAVATLDELDPAWRSYGDVDVLVPADQLLAAVSALRAEGLRPGVEPVGRRWAGRYAKSITLIHASGVQVDLHRMLAAGPFGSRVRAACLFEQGRPFCVGAAELVALSDVHRFLHACYHAALGGVRGARHRRDIALLAAVVEPDEVAAQFADGWSPAVVAAALEWTASDGTPGTPLPNGWRTWVTDVEIDEGDRSLLAAYGGSFRDIARAELRAMDHLPEKLRYAWGLLWPSRENLAARGRRRRAHLWRVFPGRGFTRRGRSSRAAREQP